MAIAATAAAASPAQSTAAVGGTALSSLSSNFSGFLRLLMTQLQNQDPTSPMDTNEFTRELVQFSSVEQQIATNTSLTRLIELTQAGEVMQSSAMIGRRIAVQSEEMPLQNGQGTLRFSVDAEQPTERDVEDDGERDDEQHEEEQRRGARELRDVGERPHRDAEDEEQVLAHLGRGG